MEDSTTWMVASDRNSGIVCDTSAASKDGPQEVHGPGARAADDDMIRLEGLDEDARGVAQHLAGLAKQVQERRIARPRLRHDRTSWRLRWA